MRFLSLLAIALLPSLGPAQPPDAVTRRRETFDWIVSLQNPIGGFYSAPRPPGDTTRPEPGLRATSSAVRVLRYLNAEIPNKEKHAAFVLACYNPETGGFAEPGGKPDVTSTSIGVMAAAALEIPRVKYARAMTYLRENARTFEEVRIGAAAVEAWGVKECPFKLSDWRTTGERFLDDLAFRKASTETLQGGLARDLGSWVAFTLRLNLFKPGDNLNPSEILSPLILDGQRSDGGWSKRGEDASDIESTYRVMRALMLLKIKPKRPGAVKVYVLLHHNTDGGFAIKPGEASSMSGAYYATVILRWLEELDN